MPHGYLSGQTDTQTLSQPISAHRGGEEVRQSGCLQETVVDLANEKDGLRGFKTGSLWQFCTE
jgi:hypothetical protein